MENLERLSFAEMEDFLKSHRHVRCAAVEKGHVYEFIEGVLQGRHYEKASRGQKGTLRRFLAKVTGLSRAQVARLVQRWRQTRQVRRKPAQRPNFPRRYRREDIVLLAQADAAAEDLSAPAGARYRRRPKATARLSSASAQPVNNEEELYTLAARKFRPKGMSDLQTAEIVVLIARPNILSCCILQLSTDKYQDHNFREFFVVWRCGNGILLGCE